MIESLRNQLNLFKNKLFDIKFHELFMRTANHRNTYLKFWIECSVTVKEILRLIRCFISFTVFVAESSILKHHSLLLRLSWLFSVNAILTIREFKIIIEDSVVREISRDVVESKMIFCREHTLLMYSRKVFEKIKKLSDIESKFSNDSSENELFDIKDVSNDVFERF
jgi:hypothetical protein